MPQVTLNGFSLNYELSGAPEAPAVLLSSSLGTTMNMWEPQLEEIRRQYAVVRYDMRGHGNSSAPDGPYTIDQLGEDVLALMRELRLPRAVFCGLSIGGMIGMWLAANAPQHFHGFILANTAAKIGTQETWNLRIAAVEQDGLASVADSVIRRWFSPAFCETHPQATAEMREMLVSCDPNGYVSACAAIRDMDLRDSIRGIKKPVCILTGEYDIVTTVADARFLEQSIAGSSLVQLPAAHISNVEAPGEFTNAVLSFLKEHDFHG
jgi:3-oxoadipate enol-lactonase